MSWTLYTLPFKSLVSDFFLFKEMDTFVQQRCIELIKHDSKYIYNVVKYLYFKYNPISGNVGTFFKFE